MAIQLRTQAITNGLDLMLREFYEERKLIWQISMARMQGWQVGGSFDLKLVASASNHLPYHYYTTAIFARCCPGLVQGDPSTPPKVFCIGSSEGSRSVLRCTGSNKYNSRVESF